MEFGFSIGGPTDELHPFTKSSETGLGYTTDSTALPRGIRQISICVYNLRMIIFIDYTWLKNFSYCVQEVHNYANFLAMENCSNVSRTTKLNLFKVKGNYKVIFILP